MFMILGDGRLNIPISSILLLTTINILLISSILGAYSFGECLFLIGYATVSATSLSYVIQLIKFLKNRIELGNYNFSPEQKSIKVSIMKKYLAKVLIMSFLMFIVPFIIYGIIKVLGLLFNFSSELLPVFYIVLLVLGIPIIVVLKNIIMSHNFMLNLYNEVLNEIPDYVDFLYYAARIYSLRNNKEQCIEILEKILNADKNYTQIIEQDTIFNCGNLHNSEEFKSLSKSYQTL